jgi:GR25 family glycosyltransferase involved in LPS biosynthesis
MAMIKEFYINLERCNDKRVNMQNRFPAASRIKAVDGKAETPESILPYSSDRDWRDPYHNRRMTKGEIGCILSHIKAWEKCVELQEPIIVLEDDVEILDPDYQSKVNFYSERYDFLYLSSKCMSEQETIINSALKTDAFYYWACAYMIKPNVAQELLDYFKTMPLIPTDEIIPAVLNAHRDPKRNFTNKSFLWAAFQINLMQPVANAFDNSETESLTDIWEDFEFHIVTVGTDESKVYKLTDDPRFNIINLGKGVTWEGGNMAAGPGGGQKINLMKSFLKNVNPNDIVMFVDGYDTFIALDKEEILSRYFGFAKEVVFSAEKTCWPSTSLEEYFPIPEVGYRYLNSGTYIGTVGVLGSMFSKEIENSEDDQLYVQKEYLTNKHNACLDHESYIFFCLAGVEDYAYYNNGWLINKQTNCTTCVVHGNGGDYTKAKFDSLYVSPIPSKPKEIALRNKNHSSYYKTQLEKDISVLHNLAPIDWCNALIEACEKDGGWKSLPNDKFPGQEIRLNALKDQRWINEFRNFYTQTLGPIAEEHWLCLKTYGLRDVFVIKYSGESQTALPLHHDMSLVSFACKLNNDYEGGELNFPRQGVSNKAVQAGDMVMWPGAVTHPHESLTMKSGIKYGLVVWSSRDSSDNEYFEK